MTDSQFHERSDDSMQQIESIIRDARHYVQPSEELRPRTIEAARERCSDRRIEQKLGGFAIAVLLMTTIGMPAIRYAESLQSTMRGPSASEMETRAVQYGAQSGIGSNWGMTEAFTQLRRVQADRLGHANRSIR